ncbi:Transcriptional regulatory protein [Bradyrhizobium sp. STM 3843]|uniref:TetR/AcrR family transcriptional regulator n=1 Tax=Bradyrhizobium sp. STM 3843 TaxID=551947 RepID=UPI000240377E|nr:TetR/AcrR family transcriptional regulator [Bradyrhizobium sp. STM 3843]CCE12079.1 Transcriptional regulatory protein [Bradyrhizobium sp. STM 3843]
MPKSTPAEKTEVSSRRGRPRSTEATAAILESAYALMADAGLAAASIDAIARRSEVSKMTIYKWWPSREALLVDAFLHRAAQTLPLTGPGDAATRLRRHAAAYAEALRGEFGRVQLAVVSECIANTGSAELFFARYLQHRRSAIVDIIAEGQTGGSITAEGQPADLYDALYGTLFYRYVFGIAPLSPAAARRLVDTLLRPRP